MANNKVFQNAHDAMQGILFDGMTILSGGFGICGIAENITEEIKASKVSGLTVVSNNCGIDGFGLGTLLHTRQIKKMISSYVGENKTFEEQYLKGELELEFSPQGTLAERCRAGGAGIPAFYTKTGVGTIIAEGKETKVIDGVEYLLEKAIKGDLSIIKAWKGDESGNLVFRKAARNFNPPMAKAGNICVVEVEQLVKTGELDPDHVHLPGIYVDRIFEGKYTEKKIEFVTLREE